MHGGHEAAQIELQFDCGSLCGAVLGADQIETWRQRTVVEHGSQLSSQPIADDSWSDGATERVGHPRGHCRRIGNVRAPQNSGPSSPALTSQARKRAAFPDAPDQADRLCRPLARRDFSTARPARVLIR